MGYTELLKNGDAKFHDMSGWKILANGGNGWNVEKGGYNGSNIFVTSFDMCKKAQEVDLYRAGLTQEYISNNKPEIIASVWVRGTGPKNFNDLCYVKVELRDANKNILDKWDTGIFKTTDQWQQLKHTFSNYSNNVRYIYWEDGGQDQEYWAGYYGARFSLASLLIDFEKPVNTTPAPPPNDVKGEEQPSEQVMAIINSGQDFIDPEFPLTDSSVYSDDWNEKRTSFKWKRARELFDETPDVFKDGTDANDIKQGALGNCWFLSALAALAEKSYYVKNIFLNETFNEAGIYEVLLYKCGLPCRIVVDEYIPCIPNSSSPCFSKSKGSELWVLLLEKAYAKMQGSYSRLTGGMAECALQDLTGCPTMTFRFDSPGVKDKIEAGTFFRELQKYCDSGYMLTASSAHGSDTNQTAQGIVLGHAYSLLAAEQVGNIQLVKMRNPWSTDVWTGPYNDDDNERWTDVLKAAVGFVKADDGCFWMSFDDFLKNFRAVGVAVTDKNLRNFRAPVEYDGQHKAVSYYVTITEPDTTIYICSHQQDTRILSSYPYICAGALLIDADGKKGLVDTGSSLERCNTGFTVVDPGTYVVVPYAFDSGNVVLSIHCDKPFTAVKEQNPFSFANSISVFDIIAQCATSQPKHQLDSSIELYKEKNSVVIVSDETCDLLFKFSLDNCELISSKGNRSQVAVHAIAGVPTFVARMYSSADSWGYSYSVSWQ